MLNLQGTLKPLLNGPLLSSHPVLRGHYLNSQNLLHIIYLLYILPPAVTSIKWKWSPLIWISQLAN